MRKVELLPIRVCEAGYGPAMYNGHDKDDGHAWRVSQAYKIILYLWIWRKLSLPRLNAR